MSTDLLEQYITEANVDALTALLTQNPALATKNTGYNVSPLMLSCYYKQPEITEVILNFVGDINLFEAAATGKFDTLAHLVYNQPDNINKYTNDGFTALGLACYFGQFETARYLVLKGADVNLPSRNGFNVYPLHSAVAGNYTDISRMLIESGADVNVKQQMGVTPLHSAAQNGNLELIILLLEKGAAVDVRMEGGKLPADLARAKGFTEIADILGQ